jgi:hypothetical protein
MISLDENESHDDIIQLKHASFKLLAVVFLFYEAIPFFIHFFDLWNWACLFANAAFSVVLMMSAYYLSRGENVLSIPERLEQAAEYFLENLRVAGTVLHRKVEALRVSAPAKDSVAHTPPPTAATVAKRKALPDASDSKARAKKITRRRRGRTKSPSSRMAGRRPRRNKRGQSGVESKEPVEEAETKTSTGEGNGSSGIVDTLGKGLSIATGLSGAGI